MYKSEGFHFKYHVLLAWIRDVPPAYDNAEFDDVRVRSVLVDDLPRRLRERLPAHVREFV